MSEIAKDIRDYLRDSAAIRDRVASRVYPNKAPAGTRGETIILTEVTATRQYSLTNEIDQRSVLLQVDCYSDQAYKSESLFDLVRNRLSGHRGTAGSATIHGTRIIGEGASVEQPADSSDQWIHRYRGDFEFFHGVTAPDHT
jgi:hypothetical protein